MASLMLSGMNGSANFRFTESGKTVGKSGIFETHFTTVVRCLGFSGLFSLFMFRFWRVLRSLSRPDRSRGSEVDGWLSWWLQLWVGESRRRMFLKVPLGFLKIVSFTDMTKPTVKASFMVGGLEARWERSTGGLWRILGWGLGRLIGLRALGRLIWLRGLGWFVWLRAWGRIVRVKAQRHFSRTVLSTWAKHCINGRGWLGFRSICIAVMLSFSSHAHISMESVGFIFTFEMGIVHFVFQIRVFSYSSWQSKE